MSPRAPFVGRVAGLSVLRGALADVTRAEGDRPLPAPRSFRLVVPDRLAACVLARHLVRFGARRELVVTWTR